MKKLQAIAKNAGITFGILGCTALVCLIIQQFSESDTHVPLLFVLAVLFVARFTDGYLYGILASMMAVVGVNCVFTYPYFEINFTITGYPLTFIAMLVVACSVSALTTQIKNQERYRLDAEKEKMRGNLLRAVSHDIRTPLTSIVGSVSAIMENYRVLPETQILDLLDGIRDEAQWLVRVVENLLSITRIGEEGARIDKQEELAEEVVSGAVQKFSKRFPEIAVQAELPEEVLLVPMDGILIEQVLVNLLENAVFHGQGTTLITIRVTDEADWVKFCVEDNGVGIRDTVLPKIFDGNLQPDSGKDSAARRSMGIGLSVCRTIIKAHKGHMKAENRKEGGARLMFWLPKGMGAEHDN